jgi:pSer/pThr/pTyr-binding forkhead associated (FHA) protein
MASDVTKTEGIGRDSQCEIRLLDHTISRRHARMIFQNEEFILEDLDSTNGTYVNGRFK